MAKPINFKSSINAGEEQTISQENLSGTYHFNFLFIYMYYFLKAEIMIRQIRGIPY